MAIFTLGHSTLEVDEFLAVAERMPADLPRVILDVRSHPVSKWTRFCQGTMGKWLHDAGMSYVWEPQLGGWARQHLAHAEAMHEHGVNVRAYTQGKFPKHHIAARAATADGPVWTNRGLYDYAWFTSLPEFQDAGRHLIRYAQRHHVAVMCAEALWWKCHRSMIADWLVAHGAPVTHLQPRITDHLAVIGNRLERYPEAVREAWRPFP